MDKKQEFPKNIVPLKTHDKDRDEKLNKLYEELQKAYENGEELTIQESQAGEDTLYRKADIMRVFKCKSDKALRILRLAFSMRLASKAGNEYYMTQKDYKEFIKHIKGRKVEL